LAQPDSVGSGQAEKRCIGNESCQSATPQHAASHTESYSYQTPTHTEVGETIETTASTEAVARGQAVVRTALTQAGALIKTWNF
jgi:hypothetical protein